MIRYIPLVVVRPFLALFVTLPVLLCTAANAQCESQWIPGDGAPGVVGVVNATVLWDRDGAGSQPAVLVVGGQFSIAGTSAVRNLATWNPQTGEWSALGTAPNEVVTAITVLPNGQLVVGGNFTSIGGVNTTGIARWNGSAWQSMGGIGGGVSALAVLTNGDLIVGGRFTAAGGVSANRVARWNGVAWFALGTGVAGVSFPAVLALAALPNGGVAIGGEFTTAGGIPASRVAMWNGTTWSAMGTGLNDQVNALTLIPGTGDEVEIVAGGEFTTAGGTATSRIAKWNGAEWLSLGTGLSGSSGANVSSIVATSDRNIVAAGFFTAAGATPTNHVARWDGDGWSPLSTGLSSSVRSVCLLPEDRVVAAGAFSSAGGVPVSSIAVWDGSDWRPTGTGFDRIIYALAATPAGEIIAGGTFTNAGEVPAARIARWNGQNWSPLGGGLSGGTQPTVRAVEVLPNGDVIAGGAFTTAGGIAANHIARWNGTQWSGLGSGMAGSTNSAVYCVAVLPNGDLIAGGLFGSAGGVPVSNIARWNGTTWSPLGLGLNNVVLALLVLPNGDLVASGGFTRSGTTTLVQGIARWDGSAWNPIGTGMFNGGNSTFVTALANHPDGSIIAGGYFTNAGGNTVNHIARWDGTSWLPFGDGLASDVNAVAVLPNGDIVAGGSRYLEFGGIQFYIARWNGTAWTPLGMPPGSPYGSAANQFVHALEMLPNRQLAVGGAFTVVGNHVSAFFARYGSLCVCHADLDNDGNVANGGVRDGSVNVNDLLFFLSAFERGSAFVDLDNGTSTGTTDNAVDINDLLFFLARFEAGC